MSKIEENAKIAYHAYGKVVGHKNFQGNPMPLWNELPEKIQQAWYGATMAIMEEQNKLDEETNYIVCVLKEDENGENHKINVHAAWKDSHHMLDMVSAITKFWKKNEYGEVK